VIQRPTGKAQRWRQRKAQHAGELTFRMTRSSETPDEGGTTAVCLRTVNSPRRRSTSPTYRLATSLIRNAVAAKIIRQSPELDDHPLRRLLDEPAERAHVRQGEIGGTREPPLAEQTGRRYVAEPDPSPGPILRRIAHQQPVAHRLEGFNLSAPILAAPSAEWGSPATS
jgi:hypothetical protein